MRLYNLSDPSEEVSFEEAVRRGLGRRRGLFFPKEIQPLSHISDLLEMSFIERSAQILSHLIGDELQSEQIRAMAEVAFAFPAPLKALSDGSCALELFHGPTLAFKDFGARFMAQCLAAFNQDQRVTILTATSGDTGAAVAHAFYKAPMIDVVVLYPKGKISPLQEALFCTLGHNIQTLAVAGDFDDCQALVKAAFDDQELRQAVQLNSANSINISRLIAQVCYYFEAAAQLHPERRSRAVYSVPSGNFGDLTAGLIARALGLPAARFIAATNSNDTVPRYLAGEGWSPRPTQATISNAMDVSVPSNWPRVEALLGDAVTEGETLTGVAVSEADTREALKKLKALGYTCEPHGAIAWAALQGSVKPDEVGVFLCTAHPAKFKEVVDEVLGGSLELPEALAKHATLPLLSQLIPPEQAALKERLLAIRSDESK